MFAIRPSRLGIPLSTALAVLLGTSSAGFAQATKTVAPQAKTKAKAAEPAKAKDPIDLNSATSEELMTLPGIGEASARKIIDGRPHKAVSDLVRSGISSTEVDKITPMVIARPLPPAVAINEDPAEKLATLPGIGPATAREIIAGRPYAKYEDLEKVKGLGPKKIDDLRGRLSFTRAEPSTKKAEPSSKKAEPASKKAEATPKKAEAAAPVPADAAKPEVAKVQAKTAEPSREKMVRPGTTRETTTAKSKLAPGTKIDLNTASKEELDALPGIGPVYAQAIIDARPFTSIEDVMKIKGIKEVEFARIKDRITVK